MKKKEIGSNNLLMLLNKKLGSKRVILVICIIFFAFTFYLENALINFLIKCINNDYSNLLSLDTIFIIKFGLLFSNKAFLITYLALFVINILATLKLAYSIYTSYSDMNIGQKGTSRFTTVEEIKEQYKEIAEKDLEFEGYGGVPVARIDDKLYIDDTNTNSIMMSITRGGKGELFVITMIDIISRAKLKASVVILDMKMEIICRSYKALANRGYEILFLNLEDSQMGVQYNPLALIVKYYISGKISDAEMLCNSFAYSIYASKSNKTDDNSAFFLDNATSALSALIIAHIEDCDEQDKRENCKGRINFIVRQAAFDKLADEQKQLAIENWKQNKPTLYTEKNICKFKYIPSDEKFIETRENMKKVTVPSIVNTFSSLARKYINPQKTELDLYFERRPEGNRAKALYASVEVSGDRTKGSIFSQALTKLNFYMYENITHLTSKSTFDVESLGFGDKPVALFIGVPFYDRSKDSIVSTLIDQIYQANARRASIEPSQKCKRRIIFHLDEIGQYPAIQDFATKLTVGLGLDMLFNLFIQSYAQFEEKYGENVLKIIRGNVGNQIYIQTSSYDEAKAFSELIGNETITNITRTGKKLNLSKTITELYEERPLIGPNELMLFMPGEIAIHRVMKRYDNKGNKVRPYPILSTEERGTSLRFAYEYLQDSFPSHQSLSDIIMYLQNKNSGDEDDPKFFDYKIKMNKFVYEHYKRIIENGSPEELEELSQDEIEQYKKLKSIYKYDQKISDIANSSIYVSFAKRNKLQNINWNTILFDFIAEVEKSSVAISEKEKIIQLINKGDDNTGLSADNYE